MNQYEIHGMITNAVFITRAIMKVRLINIHLCGFNNRNGLCKLIFFVLTVIVFAI